MSDAASTRERILAAARQLFAERGYRGATTAEIARRAGVAEGTIYRHFRDKKDLLLACVTPAIEAAVEQGLAELASAPDLPALVRTNLALRLRVLQENLESFNILFTEAPYHPELFDLFLRRLFATRASRVIPLLERMYRQGETRRVPNLLILGLGLTTALWAILSFGGRLGLLQSLPPGLGPAHGPEAQGGLLDELTHFVLYGLLGVPPEREVAPGDSPPTTQAGEP